MMMVMLMTNRDTPHHIKINLTPTHLKLKPKLILIQVLRAAMAKVDKGTKSLILQEVKVMVKDKAVITLLIIKLPLPQIMARAIHLVTVMEEVLGTGKEEHLVT
jgi:hypothetical protein